MSEIDQQLDAAQSELTKLAEGKQTGPMKVAEDIFKSGGLVDTFQTIGKGMNLESSPAAMKYLEQGGGEVAAILMQMAAAGKYLAENPDTEDLPENLRPAKKAPRNVIPGQEGKEKRPLEGGTNASSDINAMAFNVRTKIKEYQEKLKPISEIVKKGREAYPNIEKAIMKETEFDTGNIAPRDFMQILDNAIFGPDGADGLCEVRKLIENNQGLPAEFLAEMEKSFNRKTLDYYVTKKTHVAQEDLILTSPIKVEKPGEPGQFVEEGLAKYVDLKKPAKPDGEWEIVFTEAGNKLSPGTKLKILEALASVKIGIDEQVEEATCPRIAENFWKGQILLEEGKFEDAKKLLTQFRDQDMKTYEFQNNPKLKAKEQDYLARTEAMLKQIEEVTGSNKDFFDAQKLAESGDIYGAKKLLKKYLAEAEQRGKDHPDSKDFSGTAKEMIRRISLTQLESVKQKFFELLGENEKNKPQKTIHIPGDGETPGEDYDNPDYEQYAKCRKAIQEMEEGLTNGTYADFEEAFKAHGEGLKAENKWNQLGDEMAIETNGREALLDLARKYRSQKNYALAEEYFQRYFGKQLEGTRKQLTMEEVAQRYRGNTHFGIGVAKRVDQAKELWEAREAEKDTWNAEHPDMPKEKTAWDGRKAWDQMESAALREIYGQELQREQNAAYKQDPSSVGDAGEQKAWGEFMNMKGEHGQGEWWEPFAMSDATLDGIIERLPLDIALIAISGGVAAGASRVVSGAILRAGLSVAEREVFAYGVTGGARALLAPAAGFLTETAVFTMSHAALSAVRDGRFSFDSFGGFMGEWWENIKMMGGLGLVGRLGQGIKAGFIAANAMEVTGMAVLGGGHMDLHSLGMVAGLKISHAVPAAFSGEARLKRASENADKLGTEANEAVRKAMEYRAANGGKADPKLDAAARSAVEKARSASAEAETILAEILVEQEKANPQKPPEAGVKEAEIPASGEKTARAIDSHYYSQFSARPPKELWSDPSKPETSKNVAGWIDTEGKIHYNSEYFEAQYKVKMAEKEGKNVFIVDGKEMTPMEYFRTAEGKEVLQEMKRVKDHEVTHRILEAADGSSGGRLAGDMQKVIEGNPQLLEAFKQTGKEMNARNIQEFLCGVADGKVEISPENKKTLENALEQHIEGFNFDGVRKIDTRLLAGSDPGKLLREAADAMLAETPGYKKHRETIRGYLDALKEAGVDGRLPAELMRKIKEKMASMPENAGAEAVLKTAREAAREVLGGDFEFYDSAAGVELHSRVETHAASLERIDAFVDGILKANTTAEHKSAISLAYWKQIETDYAKLDKPLSKAEYAEAQKRLMEFYKKNKMFTEGETGVEAQWHFGGTQGPAGTELRKAYISPPIDKAPEYLSTLLDIARKNGVIWQNAKTNFGDIERDAQGNVIAQAHNSVCFYFASDADFQKFTKAVAEAEKKSGVELLRYPKEGMPMYGQELDGKLNFGVDLPGGGMDTNFDGWRGKLVQAAAEARAKGGTREDIIAAVDKKLREIRGVGIEDYLTINAEAKKKADTMLAEPGRKENIQKIIREQLNGDGRFTFSPDQKYSTLDKIEAIRKVAEEMGVDVRFDGSTNTVTVSMETTSRTNTAGAINSHYFSVFSERPPQELWSDPSKPETSKNVAGWIDTEGKIHYNSEYFEAQYKVKMAEKEGKNVFIVDGKEMTPMEYFRTAEGKTVLEEMKRVKDHEVTHRILEFGQNLSEGTLAQDLAKFYKDHPNIQAPGGGEMDFRRLQELTCAIADGSVKVSDAEKVALEKLIQHSLPEFRFEGVRNLDTRLLTQLGEEAFRREQPDALDIQFVRSGKINIPGYSFDGTEIASFDAQKRTVKLIRTIGNGMVTFEDVSVTELARRAREQSEKQMQPLTLGQSVKSFASDGSIRQGWFVQSIGPNGEVVIAGYKNGMAAKKTYDSMELLQREMRDAETVLKYKDTKFGLYSSKLGRGADGWEFGAFDPAKGSIQMTNSLTKETRTFRSVDEALMEIKMQEVMEGRKAYKHKAYTQFADMMQVNEFGRPKITSESETIDGGVFAPDIVKTKAEAIVVDTQKDVVLKNYIDGFMSDLDARIARGERLKPDEVLQMVARKISGDFPYSERMLDRNYADANYQGGKKYNLGVFMTRQDMVCRHMGLLAQVMIEKIKTNPAYRQLMEGVSSNFMADRQEVITDSDRSGHAYAIVAVPTPQGKKYYTIDPTRKYEPMRDLGRVVRESKLNVANARYLFSLLRTIFEKPDPSNAGILAEIFGKEKDLPALRQIARDALTATRNPDARAGVDTFRSQMGLPPL